MEARMFFNVCKRFSSPYISAFGSAGFSQDVAAALKPNLLVQQHLNYAEAIGKVVKVQPTGKGERHLKWSIQVGSNKVRSFDVLLCSSWLIEESKSVPLNSTVFVQGSLSYFDELCEGNTPVTVDHSLAIIAEKVIILEKPDTSLMKNGTSQKQLR